MLNVVDRRISSDVLDERPARRPSLALRYEFVPHAFMALDALLIVAVGILAAAAYNLAAYGNVGDLQIYSGMGTISAVAYLLGAKSTGLYATTSVFTRQREFVRMAACWGAGIVLAITAAFLLKMGATFSRGGVLTFAAVGLAALATQRTLLKHLLDAAIKRGVVRGSPVVVVGSEQELASIDREHLFERFGQIEVSRLQLPNDPANVAGSVSHVIDLAVTRAREHHAQAFVLALPWSDSPRIDALRDALRVSPLPVELLPDSRIRQMMENAAGAVSSTLSIELQRSPLSSIEQFVKRTFDIAAATIILLLLMPLLLIVAAAIAIEDGGPPLFRQRRNGFDGKQFLIYKFRTMSVMEDSQVHQAKRSDPRVTRLGRMLRRSSIDELPQLLNVLKGDMSLIGPRPHAVAHNDQYRELISDYAFRHHVKPGITGWAQVHGFRGETEKLELMKRRVELDLWYVNNWSLWLDIRILSKTCFEVARARNAY